MVDVQRLYNFMTASGCTQFHGYHIKSGCVIKLTLMWSKRLFNLAAIFTVILLSFFLAMIRAESDTQGHIVLCCNVRPAFARNCFQCVNVCVSGLSNTSPYYEIELTNQRSMLSFYFSWHLKALSSGKVLVERPINGYDGNKYGPIDQ